MMHTLGAVLQALRPMIALVILLVLFAIAVRDGTDGLWLVLRLVAIGLVLNVTLLLIAMWIWPRVRKEKPDDT